VIGLSDGIGLRVAIVGLVCNEGDVAIAVIPYLGQFQGECYRSVMDIKFANMYQ